MIKDKRIREDSKDIIVDNAMNDEENIKKNMLKKTSLNIRILSMLFHQKLPKSMRNLRISLSIMFSIIRKIL